MEGISIQKVSIWGTTLASVIQRFSSSGGDVDGVLLGHFGRLLPPELTDDDPSSSSSSSPLLSAFITNYFCFGMPMGFYDSLGRVDSRLLDRVLSLVKWPENCTVLGWFSARRNSGLRPSMREHAVSVSLSKVMEALARGGRFSENSEELMADRHAIHNHEYRAYTLEPKSRGHVHTRTPVEVVNLGPAFRSQYNLFSPESSFPWMPCGSENSKVLEDKSLINSRRTSRDSAALGGLAEGYKLERLRQMENRNLELKAKVAGLESTTP
ncbi:unnamed protein product [Spirodela intermedia]|uniref:Uncharacterized protein n=1 Tax=Spirodela intermedia TaxID=51605 RepID=A0A7I8ICV6_SPIIN|nr:unnamed protein product [Spirodela intermedia]CAA6654691.1 unnamed protein product [Spirodela intermedia]